ncbi:MAG: serine hydrolase [Bdellovibrionota bacterium]
MSELSDELYKVLSPYLKSDKLTHVFAECGDFFEESPHFSFQIAKKNGNELRGDRVYEDIFDVSSLTKALVTTPLVFNELLKSEKLHLDQDVSQWLMGCKHNLSDALSKLKIRDLLRHKSGLPAWRNFWIQRLDVLDTLNKPDVRSSLGSSEVLYNRNLYIEKTLNRFANDLHQKGEFIYSDLGFILLGFILELRNKKSLDQLFNDFASIDLQRNKNWIGFVSEGFPLERCISTGYCFLRKRPLHGEVHDENCAALYGISGHAGLFANGRAIVSYLRSLLKSKVGKTLLYENLKYLQEGNDPLCGWRQRSNIPLPYFVLGHLGFTGTAFWLSKDADRYLVLLTNRVISGRIAPWISSLRASCYEIMQKSFKS